MTAHLDPLPEPDHQPASHTWARKAALDATRAAIQAAKDRRKKPAVDSHAADSN